MKIQFLASVLAALVVLTDGCISLTPDFRDTVASAKASVSPSVVYIRVIYNDTQGGKDRKGQSSGSGVVISADGEVLTNHHVIDKTTEIRCQLADGRSFNAKVVGKDKDLDIALLKLELPEDHEPLPVAKLSPRWLDVGEVVLAMGAPWGLARSVTMGIVSCNDRFLEDCGDYTLWYQTDAAISPGNSGGPLVDTLGRVVGINARGNIMGDQGFTIPSETILEVLPDLRKYGEAHWAWFGFRLQPREDFNHNMFFSADEGAIIADIEPGSPAEKAGLRANDLLLSVDGGKTDARAWEDIPAIDRRLGRIAFEKSCAFSIVRGGQPMTLAIAPTEKGKVEGEEFACERWGLTVKEINRFYNPDLIFFAPEGGLYVSGLNWDGNAENCGFREKDIVVAIDGRPVKSVAEAKAAYEASMKNLERRTKMPVTVSRNGRPTTLVLDYTEDTEKED
jgi:serine protease Do